MKKSSFDDFLSADSVAPPSKISSQILGAIRERLDPPILSLFIKLGFIRTITGLLSLLICPQYGFFFGGDDILYVFFQKQFGPHGCMIACGMFFSSLAAFIFVLVLSRPETKKIFKLQIFFFPTLAIIFLTTFTCVIREFYLNVSLLWFTGATLGYFLSFDFGYFIKKHLNKAGL